MHAHLTGIRKPAWTDRILFKPLPGQLIKCTKYDCDDSLATSSHSPVFGTYVMVSKKNLLLALVCMCTHLLGFDILLQLIHVRRVGRGEATASLHSDAPGHDCGAALVPS